MSALKRHLCFALALLVLLTAGAVQAGPLDWLGRQWEAVTGTVDSTVNSVSNFVNNPLCATGLGFCGASTQSTLTYTQTYQAVTGIGCWSCNVVMAFVKIGDFMTKQLFLTLATALQTFFTVLFALYVLFQMMMAFTPGLGLGSSQPFRKILVSAIFFTFVNFLVFNPTGRQELFTFFYDAVMIDSLNAMAYVIGGAMSQCGDPSMRVDFGTMPPGMNTGIMAGIRSSGVAPLPQDALQGVYCALYSAQKIISVGLIIGSVNIEIGAADIGSLAIGSGLYAIALGAIIAALFGLALVGFGFSVIDVLLRMFVLFAVAPVLLMGAVFPFMRQWIVNGVTGVLNSALTFLFGSVIYSMTGLVLCNVPAMIGGENGQTFTSLEGMFAAMTTANFRLGLFSATFWITIIAGLVMFKSLSRGGALADAIVGGNMSRVGDGPGNMAAMVNSAPFAAAGGVALLAGAAGAKLAGKQLATGGTARAAAAWDGARRLVGQFRAGKGAVDDATKME